MRFAQIGARGSERPIVQTNTGTFDLTPLTTTIDGTFLETDGIGRTQAALTSNDLLPIEVDDGVRFGAPISRPSAVLCIGQNYAAHARESGSESPTAPILFLKTPNTVAGPNDAVAIPRESTKTDWEVELAVVIGARASYLDSPEDAMAHVAGFTIANDLSEREWQLDISGGQWSKGKSAPGFSPLGPWLVTPDDVDHTSLNLRSFVNGEPRQDSNTSDLIFGVEYLIWNLSQYLTLEPGDVILTGTPEGVALSGRFPYLTAGDVVTLEIDGLGTQRQEFHNA